eukprot:185928-Rhodomonas_salina.1
MRSDTTTQIEEEGGTVFQGLDKLLAELFAHSLKTLTGFQQDERFHLDHHRVLERQERVRVLRLQPPLGSSGSLLTARPSLASSIFP